MSSVCAIILNYRNAPETLQCLASLDPAGLSQVHLVDNSVSPEDEIALRVAVDSLNQRAGFPPVNVIVNPENLGYARSVNEAIARDQSANRQFDYYFLINNDAIGQANLVSRLQQAIESDNNIAAVSPGISEAGVMHCIKWYDNWFGTTTLRQTGLAFPYVTGCCLLVDATIANDGKLFDEDFFMYGEDVWLCLQIRRAGRSIRCVDDVTVMHKGAGSSRKGSLFYEYHMARAQVLIASKSSRNVLDLTVRYLLRFVYLLARSVVRSVRYGKITPLLCVPLAWLRLEIRP